MGNFIIVANNGGGIAHTVADKVAQQITPGILNQCRTVFRVVPKKAGVMDGNPGIQQGADHPVVTLRALDIVAFEDPRKTSVPLAEQILDQLLTAVEIIVQQAGKALQIAVDSMKEQHRDPFGPKPLKQVAVGVGRAVLEPSTKTALIF